MQVNQIRAGAALSYVSMALSTVISLVYTPIMLRQLGDSEFGVYQAVLPIISYLNLLSFGLGSAYVRYYSRFRAAGDKKGCAKLNGMFLITYLILGALVLAIGFGLSYCDVVFGKKLTAEEIDLAQRLLRIMSVNAALTFPISVFESHVTINERYLFQKIVAMGKQVLNPLIMIPLLLIGYRSVTLTIVSLIFTVLSGVINITYCLTRLKMPFAFRHYDFALLREMFGFTLYVFIGIVVDNINWSIDRQLLIEEPIRQHPDMNKLCPDSVNTVRIVTLVTAQGAQMVYALVRMGMGGVCVDNVSSGGMYAPVNEHGQLYRPAFCDKTGKYYERHPVTGTEITGFQIPLFDQALELCRTASRRVEAHLTYIGWDVAITPDGPVLVEGNNLPGYDMCQNAGHVDEGMLPRFEKLLGRPIM